MTSYQNYINETIVGDNALCPPESARCAENPSVDKYEEAIYISKKKFESAWNLLNNIKTEIKFYGFPKNNCSEFLLKIWFYKNSASWTVLDVFPHTIERCPILILLEPKSGTKAKLIVKYNTTEIIPI